MVDNILHMKNSLIAFSGQLSAVNIFLVAHFAVKLLWVVCRCGSKLQ
jgi:hypothetical protein